MARVDPELVKTVLDLLKRVTAALKARDDTAEKSLDAITHEVRSLPRESLLNAIDRAVGSSKGRRSASLYLLGDLADLPGALDRVGSFLKDPDESVRSMAIQFVRDRRATAFSTELEGIITADPSPFCRDLAIHAVAVMRVASCLPTLIRLAATVDSNQAWRLAAALANFSTPDCRDALLRFFKDPGSNKPTKVEAARGLAKLQQPGAIEYLVSMLDDPDISTPKSFVPGESLRAAQAICEVYGWPFVWEKKSIEWVRDRLRLPESDCRL